MDITLSMSAGGNQWYGGCKTAETLALSGNQDPEHHQALPTTVGILPHSWFCSEQRHPQAQSNWMPTHLGHRCLCQHHPLQVLPAAALPIYPGFRQA